MKKPIIGISCGCDESRLTVFQNYVSAIERAGGVPLLLPFYKEQEDLERVLDLVDGVLLTGGQDINPLEYGEGDYGKCGDIVPQRDAQDLAIAKYVVSRNDTPMLCICRGLQILNVAMGGTLYQDLESEGAYDPHRNDNDPMDAITHDISIDKNSQLYDILNADSLVVNSFHHQAIKQLGKSLRISAKSEDGVAEAIEFAGNTLIMGVQWHPERMYDDEQQNKLFATLIQRAAE